jgi:CheY-like chemotaxis protein
MKNAIGPIKLLLIEDDELSRELLTLQITACGYLLTTVDSGDAALAYLTQPHCTWPDAILTDLQMPGTSGAELARRLRALPCPSSPRTEEPPILLAMSASRPTKALSHAYDGFLLKPFTMEQLTEQLAMQWKTPNDTTSASQKLVSTPTSHPSLDEKIYQQLAGSMPVVQLKQLYTMCLDDGEARIARMRLAASKGDKDLYRQEAHTIKGSAGMVGASELQHLASAAEMQDFATANHVASLNEMLMACRRLRRILVEREE